MASNGSSAGAGKAKALVKRALDRYPGLLKDNRLYYEIQRARAYRSIQLRPELTDRPDLLERLADDGIVVIPDYMSREKAGEILDASEEVLHKAQAGELPDYTFATQPHIMLRVARADRLLAESQPFFRDPMIRGIMQAYIAPDVASYRRELESRFGLVHLAQADLFHFDNWRPICKAFLYLTDVTEANAPFAYLAGTHHPSSWRRRKEIEFDARGPTGPFGHFFPQEIRELRERFRWNEVLCTGAAGTLILADFRGLHRGTPLREGRRVLLNNTFDLMNPEAT